MTTNQFRDLISDNQDFEWLKSIKVSINYNHLKFNTELNGGSAIYEFVCKQVDGWRKIDSKLPDDFQLCLNHFSQLKEKMITVTKVEHRSSLQHSWQYDILEKLRNQTIQNRSDKKVFLYNCTETDFLLSVYKDYSAGFSSAYDFIAGNSWSSISRTEQLIGLNLAYEFSLKDYSGIVERRNAEKSSISKIRNDFHEYLNTSEKHLIERLEGINQKFKEKSTEIDETKTEKETLFTEWFEKSKADFNEFDSRSKKKIEEKEALYTEKLRLEAPVEYWNKRSIKLKAEAQKTLVWLLILVVIACISLYCLLWLTPNGLLLSLFKGDASAVKWSLIFVTYLSFLAYGIRILARITFSSFHLSRDAEEREQLTYVYLALKRDTTIDPDERKLIMQSIFSRADTGLLKEDSSPTMPGSIAGKIFQN